jgi:hypothetical protein
MEQWFTRKSLCKSLEVAGFEQVVIDIIPQLPYLSKKSAISSFVVNQLLKFPTDKAAGCIIGTAKTIIL